jgi:hypothetical protein
MLSVNPWVGAVLDYMLHALLVAQMQSQFLRESSFAATIWAFKNYEHT